MINRFLFPLLLLLLLLFQAGNAMIMGEEEGEDFFKDCPPSRCSEEGPEIRYPLRLESNPQRCGLSDMGLSCSGSQTVLSLPSFGPYNVTAIDYGSESFTISSSSWGSCPLQDLTSLYNLTLSAYDSGTYYGFVVLNCSKKFTLDASDRDITALAGPISCFSTGHGFIYAVDGYLSMDNLPRDCVAISRGLTDNFGVGITLENFAQRKQFSLSWSTNEDCRLCENDGGRCGFSWKRNQSICITKSHHSSHVSLITGVSVGIFVVLLSVVLVVLYILRKFDKEKETRIKVERFLATYKAINPTRYSYSDLKKVTKRFKQKIGQGGFGSVFKGELPDGIPVAVKMLDNSRSDGEEFINEVATIGRIHHFNIVRLLGFCSEGTRRALVYEFLPHESLEKFIFWNEGKKTRRPFSVEKLLDIAIGVAQGIEYLHQGCAQRIVHFDIKPHNILLDHNFKPKISDFGLAKLCSRDHSIVTMTAARGTMGYIAPEMYSRNFGAVSHKSDVYSFGMLVLEMVSGKKNIEPGFTSQSQVYYPEWIYERLVKGDNLGAAMEMECNEDIVKKLVIIALWCIQWSPADRPSMTRVVQMLTGSLQSLEIPSKPFISTDGNEDRSPFAE